MPTKAIRMFGFMVTAATMSPLSKRLKALVIPHPGQGIPNAHLVGHRRIFTL